MPWSVTLPLSRMSTYFSSSVLVVIKRFETLKNAFEISWNMREITELFDKPLKYSVSLMLDVDDAQLWTPDDKLVVYIDNRLVSIPYVFISTSFSVCHMVAILESS